MKIAERTAAVRAPGARRTRELQRVIRHPALRRIGAAYWLFGMAEYATWIAVTIYAFSRGGVREAGVISVVQLAPAMVFAPVAAYAGDHFRKDRVLVLGYLAQAMAMLATAAGMWSDASPLVVYGAATSAAVVLTFTRPAMGALLPAVTATPSDLTAANVCLGVLDKVGAFLGPALAGLLMNGGGDPARVFAVMGVGMVVAALTVSGLRLDRAMVLPHESIESGDVMRDALGGFRALGRAPDMRLLVGSLGVGMALAGAADVLFVAVADELFDDPAAHAGLLAAGYGLGALLAAVGSIAFVGASRLSRPLALALAASGAAIALIGTLAQPVLVLLLFMVAGAGQSVARITGTTLVQRLAPVAVMSRVFGVMEGLDMAAIAIGALGASWLVHLLGLRTALVVIGGAGLLAIGLRAKRLRLIDATAPPPPAALLRLLRAHGMFANLPSPAVERLLAGITPVELIEGDVVIRQGDRGDRYYLVERGELTVTIDGISAGTLGPGDGFGEIALVRDLPRTATVTASVPALLQAIERDDFLTALTGHPHGLGAARERAQTLLHGDVARSRRAHRRPESRAGSR